MKEKHIRKIVSENLTKALLTFENQAFKVPAEMTNVVSEVYYELFKELCEEDKDKIKKLSSRGNGNFTIELHINSSLPHHSTG